MRILQIITELNEGGAENALAEVCLRLHERGHELQVVSLYDGNGEAGLRLAERGIQVTDLAWRRALQPSALRNLRDRSRGFAPEVVHAWLFHAGMAARFAGPRRTPLICGLRVSEPRTLHLLLERLTRGLVDRYVCVSPAVAAFARARLHVPQARLRVITNGVHPVPDAPEQPRPPRRPVHGLTIGRLTRQKGVDVLLRALARLPRSLDWTWSVVGPEPEPRYAIQMKQLATELGLGQRVRWLGPVPRERTAGLYAEADVFVLASRWEGQPNVVLEAFAHTLPVVATAVDGTADLDNEAPGCLEPVPPEDPAALADAIARVATDASLRRRRAMLGRQLVARRSWNRVTDAYEQLYTELTTQATASPSPG